jgi:hypothetical protein
MAKNVMMEEVFQKSFVFTEEVVGDEAYVREKRE